MKYIELLYFKLFYSIVYNTHAAKLNPDAGDGNSHPRARVQLSREGPADDYRRL